MYANSRYRARVTYIVRRVVKKTQTCRPNLRPLIYADAVPNAQRSTSNIEHSLVCATLDHSEASSWRRSRIVPHEPSPLSQILNSESEESTNIQAGANSSGEFRGIRLDTVDVHVQSDNKKLE